ncbi:MAG: carboxylesterase [Xanthomonadales bacterium]|nr:carboxylesterase [Xanthomonadales bacterium]
MSSPFLPELAMLDCLEIETASDPTAAVIWLHGLGADGHDFEPIVPQLAWPGQPAIRYVFPHAPTRPVTINNGIVMRAWYDITGFDLSQREDETGMRQSAGQVDELIEREIGRGIAPERIVLAGFSQGGAVALFTGLRRSRRLAAIIALSTYLALREQVSSEADPANHGTPIWMAHGNMDPVVPIQLGEASANYLRSLGYEVSWETYPIPHGVSPDEIDAIRRFLSTILA